MTGNRHWKNCRFWNRPNPIRLMCFCVSKDSRKLLLPVWGQWNIRKRACIILTDHPTLSETKDKLEDMDVSPGHFIFECSFTSNFDNSTMAQYFEDIFLDMKTLHSVRFLGAMKMKFNWKNISTIVIFEKKEFQITCHMIWLYHYWG